MILFAIDCSESMLELREDPDYEDVKTCHLLIALEAAMQVQKRKVLVGPNDAVGIMLFNTVCTALCVHMVFPVHTIRHRRARTKVQVRGPISGITPLC